MIGQAGRLLQRLEEYVPRFEDFSHQAHFEGRTSIARSAILKASLSTVRAQSKVLLALTVCSLMLSSCGFSGSNASRSATRSTGKCSPAREVVGLRAASKRAPGRTFVLTFTNASMTTCSLGGYPSVTATSNLIRHSGSQFPVMETASRLHDGQNHSPRTGPPSVQLRRGSAAYALLTLHPKLVKAGTVCPTYDILSVQMPASKKTTYFKVNISACDSLEIQPIVPHISEVPGSVVV